MPNSRIRIALVMLLVSPVPVFGQTNQRAYESIEFRVVTPGARAVAMGKTFVGIADDATAAASNPAGLSNLFDPEVSFEWSRGQIRQTRMQAVNPPNNLTFVATVAEPTFVSFVTPLPDRRIMRNFTVAVFYNSLQRYEEHFDLPPTNAPDNRGYFGDMDIRARAFGFGGAALVGPRVSIGASLTIKRLSNFTKTYGYNEVRTRFRNGSETDDSDVRTGGQVGVLFKPASGVSIGAAYLAGTTFQLETTLVGVFSPENSPPLPALPVETYGDPVRQIDYRIPDRLTAGGAVRVGRALTVVGDIGLVMYSQRITKNFLIVDFMGQLTSSGLNRFQYYFDDAIEIHTGFEYRRNLRSVRAAFRAGYFSDPDHGMRFDLAHSNMSPQARGQDVSFNTYQQGTVHGITFGAGMVLKNRVQIDGAVSLSENERQLVISSVMRFPR